MVPGYYAVMCAPTAAVFAVAWVVFGYVDDSWWQLFPATFPILVCTQLSLIGHNADLGGGPTSPAPRFRTHGMPTGRSDSGTVPWRPSAGSTEDASVSTQQGGSR